MVRIFPYASTQFTSFELYKKVRNIIFHIFIGTLVQLLKKLVINIMFFVFNLDFFHSGIEYIVA